MSFFFFFFLPFFSFPFLFFFPFYFSSLSSCGVFILIQKLIPVSLSLTLSTDTLMAWHTRQWWWWQWAEAAVTAGVVSASLGEVNGRDVPYELRLLRFPDVVASSTSSRLPWILIKLFTLK
jgi:hypothetical protein